MADNVRSVCIKANSEGLAAVFSENSNSLRLSRAVRAGQPDGDKGVSSPDFREVTPGTL